MNISERYDEFAPFYEFSTLTKSMNIPDERREVNQINLKWFLRNGAILNRNHINCDKAIRLAQKLIEV